VLLAIIYTKGVSPLPSTAHTAPLPAKVETCPLRVTCMWGERGVEGRGCHFLSFIKGSEECPLPSTAHMAPLPAKVDTWPLGVTCRSGAERGWGRGVLLGCHFLSIINSE
jgi:hypothetical protein